MKFDTPMFLHFPARTIPSIEAHVCVYLLVYPRTVKNISYRRSLSMIHMYVLHLDRPDWVWRSIWQTKGLRSALGLLEFFLAECKWPVDEKQVEIIQLQFCQRLIKCLVAAAVVAFPNCEAGNTVFLGPQERKEKSRRMAHRGGSGTASRR